VIAALLSQRTIDDAARAAGVGAITVLRWTKLPEFQAAYLEARRAGVHQAVARMQHATSAAGTVILRLMTDPNVPAAVRLRAADSVFPHAIKGIELEDVEVRLVELERAAETAKNKR